MGAWIQLASGGAYDFDKAIITGPFTVDGDIAKPLAGLNRFVNHTTQPVDVASHSVAVARTIFAVTGNADAAAAGLLHEAHEAIIGDIPTPVAWEIGYERVKKLKRDVQAAIYERLSTPTQLRTETHHGVVELADHAALYVEKQMYMVPEPAEWSVKVPPHEWMLAMHRVMYEMDRGEVLNAGPMHVFIHEYRRFVDGSHDS